MEKKDVQISVRTKNETKDDLELLAEMDDRTLSYYCNKVFEKHLKEQKSLLIKLKNPPDKK